jgi:hypothetical protein
LPDAGNGGVEVLSTARSRYAITVVATDFSVPRHRLPIAILAGNGPTQGASSPHRSDNAVIEEVESPPPLPQSAAEARRVLQALLPDVKRDVELQMPPAASPRASDVVRTLSLTYMRAVGGLPNVRHSPSSSDRRLIGSPIR